MTKITNYFLAITLIASVTGGILDFGKIKINTSLAIMLSMGAVFFGRFLFFFMIEKKIAKFNEENALKYERIRHKNAGNSNCRNCKKLRMPDTET